MSTGQRSAGQRHHRMSIRQQLGNPFAVSFCHDCGTWSYDTRGRAKHAGKALYPGVHMHAYRCGERWHLDELDEAVIRGERGRDE